MNKQTSKYVTRLISMVLAISVLVGIPAFFGNSWFLISWLPALLVFLFLEA